MLDEIIEAILDSIFDLFKKKGEGHAFDRITDRKQKELTPLQNTGRERKDRINESWAAYKVRCTRLDSSGYEDNTGKESLYDHIHRFLWAVYEIAFNQISELIRATPPPQCYIDVWLEKTGYRIHCHLSFEGGKDRYQILWWLLDDPDTTVPGITYTWENGSGNNFEFEWPDYVVPTYKDRVRGIDYRIKGIVDLCPNDIWEASIMKSPRDVIDYVMGTSSFSDRLVVSRLDEDSEAHCFAAITVNVAARERPQNA